MDDPSYYAIIPASVRYDKQLVPNAKLLYSEISALCNAKGYCWASNEYFAQLYDVHKNTISIWINLLAQEGYIEVSISKDDGNARRIRLTAKMPTINENIDTYQSKQGYPITEKIDTSQRKAEDPINENLKHNIKLNITKNIKENNTKEKISFSFETGGFENISPQQIQVWSQAYPAIDIELTMRQAAQWLLSNPKKAKSNYRRFLTNWFARCQDRGPAKGVSNARKYRQNTQYQQHNPAAIEL
ncbi:MAG: hypothetical protein A2Y07_01190 [Planctomycetes bacterium GWF2_50_10]|nr:MAG: hypothetical protein A2Y07_01190 [Planctomycetes bacterium GWF2_50_10]